MICLGSTSRWSAVKATCTLGHAHTGLVRGPRQCRWQVSQHCRRTGSSSSLVPHAADEGPELVPISDEGSLDGSSEEAFGPLAALVIGLTVQQVLHFRAMMSELEAEMVQVVPCTCSLLQQPLGKALSASAQAKQEEPLIGQKRMVIVSGMYSSEVFSIMAAYKDAGLPECVWAAAVPANMDTRLDQLVDDVYGDHNYMQTQHA